MSEKELRRYSRVVVDGVEQAPSRAMLRAVGFSEEDFQRPQVFPQKVGVAVTGTDESTDSLRDLAVQFTVGE